LLQELDGRGGEDAVAERAESDDGDAAAGGETVERGHSASLYSSMVASSMSMTGISSRIG
jgi:hypothetical protein